MNVSNLLTITKYMCLCMLHRNSCMSEFCYWCVNFIFNLLDQTAIHHVSDSSGFLQRPSSFFIMLCSCKTKKMHGLYCMFANITRIDSIHFSRGCICWHQGANEELWKPVQIRYSVINFLVADMMTITDKILCYKVHQ